MAIEIQRSRRSQSISVPRQPRLDPRVGAQVGEAVAQGAQELGNQVAQIVREKQRARNASALMKAETDATTALTDLELEFEKDTDFKTQEVRFPQRAEELRDRLAGTIDDAATREKFTLSFDRVAGAKRSAVVRRAFRREVDETVAGLDGSLTSLAREAGFANNDIEREAIVSQGFAQIGDMAESGFITQQDAERRRQVFRTEIDTAQVRELITDNPSLAITMLKDRENFPALDPTNRAALADQAKGREAALAAREEARLAKVRRTIGSELADLEEVISAGFDAGARRLEAVKGAIDAAGDPQLSQRFNDIQKTAALQEQLRVQTPADLQNFVNAEQTRLNKKRGVSAAEVERLGMAEKLLTTMKTEVARDPISWGNRVGLFEIEPLQIIGDQAATSMRARVGVALAAAGHYGVPPRFTTDEEAEQLKIAFETADPDGQLALAVTIREGFGSHAPRVFKDIAKDAPVVAHAAGLTALGAGHLSAGRDILAGHAAIKEGNDVLPPPSDRADWTDDAIGGSLGELPKVRAAVLDSAKAIYTTRALRRGITKDTPDEDLWTQALHEATGGTIGTDGERMGGIGEYRGVQVIVPPTMKTHEFERRVQRLVEVDNSLRRFSVGGGPPIDTQGRELLPKDLDDVWLVSVGNGQYQLSSTDPRAGPASFFQGTGPQGFYVLDLIPRQTPPAGEATPQVTPPPTTPGPEFPARTSGAPTGFGAGSG